MSFDKEIGAPFTLASLPHPISSQGGRTHATTVCSISGTKKKKRTEVAVGLDGEGISIYSLQNPQLVTSYALPPQTSFASAPYSVYYKGSSKRAIRRYTYAFISENTPGATPHLVCFAEENRENSTADTVKTTYTPSETQGIVSIEIIPVSAGPSQPRASHQVLAVFANGHAICLSPDLEVVQWVANVSPSAPSSNATYEIDYVSISPARTLTRGLLKNREDIVAVLNPSLDEESDLLDLTQVMSVICRQTDGRRILALFQIQPRSPDLLSSRLPPLKHLTSWEFPESQLESTSTAETKNDTFILHASSGSLHHLSHSALVTYDFAGVLPTISSKLDRAVLAIDSILRISQDLLLTASRTSCQILNVKYNSIHAERPVEQNTPSSAKEDRKRKHTISESGEARCKAPLLVAFYSDSGLAVGSWNNELVGFQLGNSTRRKRVKSQGARLIDSLGKGISSSSKVDQPDMAAWQEKTPKLDRYARNGHVAKFEEIFAAELGVKLESPENAVEEGARLVNGNSDATVPNGSTNGVDLSKPTSAAREETSDLPRKWVLSKILSKTMSAAKRSRHQQYAAYALSKIFQWVGSPSLHGPSGCLKIEFFPPNVFEWLMHSGNLTKESIRRALLDDPSNNLSITTPIRDGDIVRAVVDFDPELHILSAILNHSHFLPIGEVVQAVRFLMHSLDDQPKTESAPKLLTNGTEPQADAMDVDIASELEAASHEIDRALARLDDGLAVIGGTLRPALMRLHTFPANVISSTLRSMLSRHDLESLIKLLHHELRNGGWTSPYDFGDLEGPESDPPSEETDDNAVAIIASLMSCTLDAIGPALWLTPVGDTSTENLIQELREDTEEALTGFWEARYIRGILSELLRYSSQMPKSQKPSSKVLEKQGKPFALDTKPDELPMLPLGSKPDLGVKKTKAGKGGQRKERSAREMGMLISKRVPKYSLERIAI